MRATVTMARAVARAAHAGQVDKAGKDYFTGHVRDVVERLDGETIHVRATAYLHDVVEDTAVTLDDLWFEDFPAEVVEAVNAITHRPNEPRDDYYTRVKANPIALKVKLADIASNTDPDRMRLLDEETQVRLIRKYTHALEVLQG